MSDPRDPYDTGNTNETDGAEGEATPTKEPRRSHSTKSRETSDVRELVLEFIGMTPTDLDLLDPPAELRDELEFCKGLSGKALSRHKRLIAQLVRAEDVDDIRARIKSLSRLRVSGSPRDRRAQAWVKRLVDEGDQHIQTFIEEHPSADRSQLRTLSRTARSAPEATKGKRARKQLLEVVRSLID